MVRLYRVNRAQPHLLERLVVGTNQYSGSGIDTVARNCSRAGVSQRDIGRLARSAIGYAWRGWVYGLICVLNMWVRRGGGGQIVDRCHGNRENVSGLDRDPGFSSTLGTQQQC